jgi:hypothetical protein
VKGYPRWFERVLVVSSVLVYASGCLLVPNTLEVRTAWGSGWHLLSGSRVPLAALHTALAFLMMMIIGALWSVHMRAGWRRHRQRWSGLLLASTYLLLMATAVGIYYLSNETWANLAGLSHMLLGVALLAPFAWHAVVGWRHRYLVRQGRA